MNLETPQPAAALVNALRGLSDAGHMPPDDIVAEIARTFRKHFKPCERLCLALGAMHSLSPDARRELVGTAERLGKSEDVFRRVGYRHHRHPVARHG